MLTFPPTTYLVNFKSRVAKCAANFFFSRCLRALAAGGEFGRARATAAGKGTPGGAGDPDVEAAGGAGGELQGPQSLRGEEGSRVLWKTPLSR